MRGDRFNVSHRLDISRLIIVQRSNNYVCGVNVRAFPTAAAPSTSTAVTTAAVAAWTADAAQTVRARITPAQEPYTGGHCSCSPAKFSHL